MFRSNIVLAIVSLSSLIMSSSYIKILSSSGAGKDELKSYAADYADRPNSETDLNSFGSIQELPMLHPGQTFDQVNETFGGIVASPREGRLTSDSAHAHIAIFVAGRSEHITATFTHPQSGRYGHWSYDTSKWILNGYRIQFNDAVSCKSIEEYMSKNYGAPQPPLTHLIGDDLENYNKKAMTGVKDWNGVGKFPISLFEYEDDSCFIMEFGKS